MKKKILKKKLIYINREGLLKLRDIYSKNQKFGDSQSADLALQANEVKLTSLYENLKKYQEFYAQVEQNTATHAIIQQQQQQNQQQSQYFECSSNCSGSSDSNSGSHIGGNGHNGHNGGMLNENCMKREDKLPDMSSVRALQNRESLGAVVNANGAAPKLNEYSSSNNSPHLDLKSATNSHHHHHQTPTTIAAATLGMGQLSVVGHVVAQTTNTVVTTTGSSGVKLAPLVKTNNNESFEEDEDYDLTDEIDDDGCYEIVNRKAFHKNGNYFFILLFEGVQ
jgi:hypothetical protein